MTYEPKPIETADVRLPDAVGELIELLARNTHDVWAVGRMKEGWTYGTSRNDAEKRHPCLVPYEDLPDSEKEYDRASATQALKAIISLGYRIEKA